MSTTETPQNKTLLIVDDEEYVRDGLKAYFEKKGFVAHTAGSATQAWAVVTSTKIDLIISDVRMDDGTGADLVAQVATLDPGARPPVILVTGYSEMSNDELLNLGAAIVVSKPFAKKELLELVNKTLSSGAE